MSASCVTALPPMVVLTHEEDAAALCYFTPFSVMDSWRMTSFIRGVYGLNVFGYCKNKCATWRHDAHVKTWCPNCRYRALVLLQLAEWSGMAHAF